MSQQPRGIHPAASTFVAIGPWFSEMHPDLTGNGTFPLPSFSAARGRGEGGDTHTGSYHNGSGVRHTTHLPHSPTCPLAYHHTSPEKVSISKERRLYAHEDFGFQRPPPQQRSCLCCRCQFESVGPLLTYATSLPPQLCPPFTRLLSRQFVGRITADVREFSEHNPRFRASDLIFLVCIR